MTLGTTVNKPNCLIVGAGICGLIVATILQGQGWPVTVLDKGRGLGGRLATRRLRHADQVGCFDYGAQYFTVSQPAFQAWVDQWQAAGVVTPWGQNFAKVDGTIRQTDKVAYRGLSSNRGLAQYLAQNLTVFHPVRVERLCWQKGQWWLEGDNAQDWQADIVVLTPPLPQSLDLLAQSQIALPTDVDQALAAVSYTPCLALLALLEKPSRIPAPGGLWGTGEPLVWLACNENKGISPQGHAVTLHAGPQFSQAYFSASEAEITAFLLAAAAPWLGSPPLTTHLHRWRYSLVTNPYPDSYLSLDQPGPLYLGGDAFGAGKIEGAVLSGHAMAEQILSHHVP
ncbi:FAD-dependent oxidoreductase [Synechocystis sp. LKSZ1]|uniref:NAD(P)/FAD-dependent oxidoreductase n=1 Tax=Synechocystis sp. LKSZ1 TaxID=3144951 RepID=UPI00336C07E7